MGKERYEGLKARLPARIQSALARQREEREQRKLAHEGGHQAELCYPGERDGHFQDEYPDIYPGAEPTTVYECKDTRWLEDVRRTNEAYTKSITQIWDEISPEDDYLLKEEPR